MLVQQRGGHVEQQRLRARTICTTVIVSETHYALSRLPSPGSLLHRTAGP